MDSCPILEKKPDTKYRYLSGKRVIHLKRLNTFIIIVIRKNFPNGLQLKPMNLIHMTV